MTLKEIVLCSGGISVVQRGARPPADGPTIRVGDITDIERPLSPPVETRRADTVVWRRHWLLDDRLVIEFIDLATVEVDSVGGTVVFDRSLPPEMEQHLLFDHVLPLVLAANGGLVLHAGVISREGKGVVLVGASGAGKSTLTAFSWREGWTVGGDDGAVVVATDPPTVEPTYATVRLTPYSADLLGIALEATSSVVGKMRVTGSGANAFRQDPVELKVIAIVQPAAAGALARFERLAAAEAHARLFGSTFHADLSRSRHLPAIVSGLASIVERTTVGCLTVPAGLDGLVAAEATLRALLDSDGGTAEFGRVPGERAL